MSGHVHTFIDMEGAQRVTQNACDCDWCSRIRIEVSDRFGTVAENFGPHHLPPGKRAKLESLAARLVSELAAVLGHGEDHGRQVAIAMLMRLQADEAAYARVSESKGLLPL